MHPIRSRVGALLVATVLAAGAPALAAVPVASATETTTAGTTAPSETLTMTVDFANKNWQSFSGGNCCGLDMTEAELAPLVKYYSISTSDDGYTLSIAPTSFASEPWRAPASFALRYEWDTFDDAGNYVTTLHGEVDVKVTHIPANPTGDGTGTGTGGSSTSPVRRPDVLSMWDGGSARPVRPRTQVRIPVSGTATSVGRLNSQMRTYFTARVDHGDVVLAKRPGAPRPPARYWTRSWFKMPYTATVTAPASTGASSTSKVVDGTVTFTVPKVSSHLDRFNLATAPRAAMAQTRYGRLPLLCS